LRGDSSRDKTGNSSLPAAPTVDKQNQQPTRGGAPDSEASEQTSQSAGRRAVPRMRSGLARCQARSIARPHLTTTNRHTTPRPRPRPPLLGQLAIEYARISVALPADKRDGRRDGASTYVDTVVMGPLFLSASAALIAGRQAISHVPDYRLLLWYTTGTETCAGQCFARLKEREHKTIAIAHQAQSFPQTAGPDATRKHMLT
jgi:hypothetical protein